MDGLSPRSWIVAEDPELAHDCVPVSVSGPVSLSVAIPSIVPPPTAIPDWLAILPGPSAILRARADGSVIIVHANALFGPRMVALLDPQPDAPDGETLPALYEAAAEFAASDQSQLRVTVERQGDLGREIYTAIFGRMGDDGSILLNIHDRTSEKRIEDNLRKELICDALTTLPNRAGFGEAAEQRINDLRASDSDIMVLIVDLVRFSRINESLGSMQGDELILAVARRLSSLLSDDYSLARIGGDEFAICATLTNGVSEAMGLWETIKAAIGQPVRLASFQLSIDCAIGCSIAPARMASVDELVRQAQSAVREAKKTDRLEIYRTGGLKEAKRRFLVESRLREALANGGLTLVYQPLVNLSTNAIVGFESLTRWRDAELGDVYPDEFIAVAEDSGLIVQLGRWALNEAMQQLARWDRINGSEVPIKMNVNLSPLQMARDDVVSTVADALRFSGVDGHRLMLELTESALVGDPAHCRKLLAALKSYNVAIAMDDFGTGYSNMASLQSLPIDVLKIDRSFVTDMLNDDDKLAIIRAILSLAEALKMSTTAEGIETPAVADALRDLGCTTGQGYFYARPMTADDAWHYWLARWNFETI